MIRNRRELPSQGDCSKTEKYVCAKQTTFGILFVAVLALASPAQAEPDGVSPNYSASVATSQTVSARRHRRDEQAVQVGRVVETQRPADCYGIPWCGCWLRHYLHVADKAFNLAYHWRSWGRSAGKTPAVGYVAVFKHSHVGVVTAVIDDKTVMIKSGNDGHAVRERPRPISSIAEFRAPS